MKFNHLKASNFSFATLKNQKITTAIGIFARYKKIPANANLLKILNTPNKSPNGKSMRTRFLKEAFYLNDSELIKIGGLSGKRIGVVDDFMNTGATLSAIAALLKENGASWVSNWIILRTPSPELY